MLNLKAGIGSQTNFYCHPLKDVMVKNALAYRRFDGCAKFEYKKFFIYLKIYPITSGSEDDDFH
jgi:hypothetical protein